MARGKKDSEEILEPLEQSLESLDENNDEALSEEIEEAKPKSRRLKRRGKLQSPLINIIKESEEPEMNENEPVEETISSKKSRGKSSEVPQDKQPVDPSLKPWLAMNEITQAICSNLERVSAMMQEFPKNYSVAMQEALKPASRKSPLYLKLASGFSAFALILSFISLSLAQSARQSALSGQTAKLSSAGAICMLPTKSAQELASVETAPKARAKKILKPKKKIPRSRVSFEPDSE